MKFKVALFDKKKEKIGKERCYIGQKGNIEEYLEYYKQLKSVKKAKLYV